MAFAGEGSRVAIASRGQENLDRAHQLLAGDGFEVVTARADLSKPEEAQSAVAAAERLLGPIDVLINCAGAANRFQVDAYNAAAWQQGLNSKYFPQINAMDAVRPGMIQRRRGAIVNIIGMGGKSAQQVFLSGGAANAALMLVTVGWANTLGRHGIRVNGINPGSTSPIASNAVSSGRPGTRITEAEALRTQPGAHPTRPLRPAGGSRGRCVVPGIGSGELRDRHDHSHGRRFDAGNLSHKEAQNTQNPCDFCASLWLHFLFLRRYDNAAIRITNERGGFYEARDTYLFCSSAHLDGGIRPGAEWRQN